MKQRRVTYVKDIAHPPTKENNAFKFLDFRPSEMKAAIPAWLKKDVLLRHRPDLGVIGQVRKLEHEPGGPLYSHLILEDSTEGGRMAIDGIEQGK